MSSYSVNSWPYPSQGCGAAAWRNRTSNLLTNQKQASGPCPVRARWGGCEEVEQGLFVPDFLSTTGRERSPALPTEDGRGPRKLGSIFILPTLPCPCKNGLALARLREDRSVTCWTRNLMLLHPPICRELACSRKITLRILCGSVVIRAGRLNVLSCTSVYVHYFAITDSDSCEGTSITVQYYTILKK
jgi:hypothetical protein